MHGLAAAEADERLHDLPKAAPLRRDIAFEHVRPDGAAERDAQADHIDGNAALKNELRGGRVVARVRLDIGRDVAAADAAAHHHDLFDPVRQVRVLLQGQRDIRQRRDRHEDELALRGLCDLIELVPRGQIVRRPVGLRQDEVPHAVGTVALRRRRAELRLEIAVRAACHRDIRPEQGEDVQRVLRRHIRVIVAAHGSHRQARRCV